MVRKRTILFSIYIILAYPVYSQSVDNESSFVIIASINNDFTDGKIDLENMISQKFYSLFDKNNLDNEYKREGEQYLKCATGIFIEYDSIKTELNTSERNELDGYINWSSINSNSSKSFISPSGLFELSYETTGNNSVPLKDADSSGLPDYIELIAEYCDYSLNVFTDSLNFISPIDENKKYKIEFMKMNAAGFTIRDENKAGETKIVLNNNLIEFGKNFGDQTDTMGTAKVTVAHELKHALQFEYSGWCEKSWFLELDATWAEDIVFDSVNNYYNYLNTSQITFPSFSFSNGLGYGNSIWMHYLTQSFGIEMNKLIWEILSSIEGSNESIYSVFNKALETHQSSLKFTAGEYFLWNYFSGQNTVDDLPGYNEAVSYPTPNYCKEIYSLPHTGNGLEREKLSANFISVKSDKSNSTYELHLTFDDSDNQVAVVEYLSSGEKNILYLRQEGDSVNYTSETLLRDIDKLVLIPVAIFSSSGDYDYSFEIKTRRTSLISSTEGNEDVHNEYMLSQNYPNPFNPSTVISFQLAVSGHVKLVVYDILGHEVQILVNEEMKPGSYEITFGGSNIPSGVYIYKLVAGDFSAVRKMLLIK